MNGHNTYKWGNHTILVTVIVVVILAINLSVVNAATSVSISDPVGDFLFPDITKLNINVTNSNLNITITHVDDVFDPLGLRTSAGIIFIDTDLNYTTGINNTGWGADFQIEYNVNKYFKVVHLVNSNAESIDISANVNVKGKQIFFSVPLSLLDNDDGIVNLFIATKESIWIGSTFDRAPDYGVLNTGNGLIEIPFPYNELAGGTIIDSIDDSGYPDVTEVNATIDRGSLNVVVTYKEDLIDTSVTKGAYAWINLDTDQSLATGFTNTGQNPPTFGIDYRINYHVSALLGTPSAFIEDGIGSTNVGLPYNDGIYKYGGNQIFLSVPLGLLDFDDGNLYLHIYSFNPNTIPSTADIDNVPDYGEGALNTLNGEIQPLVSCIGDWVTVTDPDNDSYGFGLEGDEITGVSTCKAANSIIVKTMLKRFDLDDRAATNIYLDVDQNPNTGLEFSNEANTIGAEYMVSSARTADLMLHTFLSSLEGEDKQVDQLAIPLGTQIVVTVPLELIGNDDGAVDMLVQTSDPDYFLQYDIAPNTGIISLSPNLILFNQFLNTGWNLISIPLNLSSWELGNESVVGNPLNVTPKNSLTSIYRYNTTSGLFEKCDHFDDWGWWQATGSESFTKLEPSKGYWMMAKQDCNLTFTGTAPSDLNVTVKKGWNLIGWYSLSGALLGEEAVVGNPLNITPKNSLTSIYRYNTTSGLFEKCDHFDDWGWWQATGSESFTELEAGRGYWVMAKNDCVWRHEA